MFEGNNATEFFGGAMERNFFGYDLDPSTQLQLYGHAPVPYNVNATNFTGNNDVPAMKRPNKRIREMEDTGRQHKLHISLNSLFQDEADLSRRIPNLNSVSTGLRLSNDDDERHCHSSVTSASGTMSALPTLLSLDGTIKAEIDSQKEEVNQFMRVQEECMLKGLREMRQRQISDLVNAVEHRVSRKLREKDLEIESMNRRTIELVEQIKQHSLEIQSWQQKAQYAESMANVLNGNLKQALAQVADQGREGYGDSEVDTASSSNHPNHTRGAHATKGLSNEPVQIACKACWQKEACMLLTPCSHLCLCEDCEEVVEACLICRTAKTGSIRVQFC